MLGYIIIIAVIAGFLWLVHRVGTNAQQIEKRIWDALEKDKTQP